MRTTSADISRDEQIHVATNSLVCRELGLDISPSLDKLRKATINWVMQPLSQSSTDRFLDKKFWLDSSDRLMYEGKAPELSVTEISAMPAFFEHSNVNLPNTLSYLETMGMEHRAMAQELDETFHLLHPHRAIQLKLLCTAPVNVLLSVVIKPHGKQWLKKRKGKSRRSKSASKKRIGS